MGAIFGLLGTAAQLYAFLILIRTLVTWIPNIDPYHPVMQILAQATEPVLEPARRLIPPIGMVDISPIVVFFGFQILSGILQNLAATM